MLRQLVGFVAGVTLCKALGELRLEDFGAGLGNKVLGQVEPLHRGIASLADEGSFTLMAEVLADDPIVTVAVASTVNGAVEPSQRRLRASCHGACGSMRSARRCWWSPGRTTGPTSPVTPQCRQRRWVGLM